MERFTACPIPCLSSILELTELFFAKIPKEKECIFIHKLYIKCIFSLLFAALVISGQPAYAQEVSVSVNGAPIEASAFVRDGLTYAPLTPLLRAMGGWETSWDPRSRTASAETDLFTLSVPIGRDYVTADGFLFGLNGQCIIENSRTYVPLRAFANLFGASVTFSGWDTPIAVTTGQTIPCTGEDFYWLARVISAESRGESLYGQIAVGNVVLNRVASAEFPNTVRSVVFDTKNAVQFEPTANGTIYLEPTAQSVLAARLALSGANAVDDCLYFFSPALSQGTWIRENRSYYTTIGCHRFYR